MQKNQCRPIYIFLCIIYVFCSGHEKSEQVLHLLMNPEHLNVSWKPPSQLLDNLREYVVQYKEVGCPAGKAFDWVKVNKSQTRAFFRGTFDYLLMFDVVIEMVNAKYCL